VAVSGDHLSVSSAASLFLLEAVGAGVIGLAAGSIAFYAMRAIDDYVVEIFISLALVTVTYALAGRLHTSGPIAVVVAGLLIGNHGRQWAMSDTTREHLDNFWELLDELLNAVLFVLIGLEVLVLSFQRPYLLACMVAIPLVLASRWVSIVLQVKLFSLVREFSERTITILTWGGLRGGISVALALSLPAGGTRDAVVTITYAVVVFSILVQGLTINRVIGMGTSKENRHAPA